MLLFSTFLSEGVNDFSIGSQSMRRKRAAPAPMGQFEFSDVGQVCLTVNIVQDSLLEFDEEFSVDLTGVSPSGVQLQPLASTSIVINDDEGMISIIREGEGYIYIQLANFQTNTFYCMVGLLYNYWAIFSTYCTCVYW